jgi:hypothetical protein
VDAPLTFGSAVVIALVIVLASGGLSFLWPENAFRRAAWAVAIALVGPAIALSVLGGLQVFGPIGILVGPMVVVFLQTLLEILNHELKGRAAAHVTQAG